MISEWNIRKYTFLTNDKKLLWLSYNAAEMCDINCSTIKICKLNKNKHEWPEGRLTGECVSVYSCLNGACRQKRGVNWLFVVVEDVDGPRSRHQPHEPAHVSGQRAQLAEVQPAKQTHKRQRTPWGLCADGKTRRGPSASWNPPRSVGGRDEEVDDHPVAHVEAVLNSPGRKKNTV